MYREIFVITNGRSLLEREEEKGDDEKNENSLNLPYETGIIFLLKFFLTIFILFYLGAKIQILVSFYIIRCKDAKLRRSWRGVHTESEKKSGK